MDSAEGSNLSSGPPIASRPRSRRVYLCLIRGLRPTNFIGVRSHFVTMTSPKTLHARTSTSDGSAASTPTR